MPEALQPRAIRVLYHFVSSESFKHTCENLLASFLHQLFKEFGSSIKHAPKHFEALGEEIASSLDVLTRIFSNAIAQQPGTTFIAIIDSFDVLNPGERRRSSKLLSVLEEIPNLGCIVACRNRSDLHNLAESQYVTLSLSETEGLRHDIEREVRLRFPWSTPFLKISFAIICNVASGE